MSVTLTSAINRNCNNKEEYHFAGIQGWLFEKHITIDWNDNS